MKIKQVELFYDIVSPYSLLAFQVLRRYAPVWGEDASTFLKLRPTFLGGVMAATSNRPPAATPAKAPYMAMDLRRRAHHVQCPLQLPPKFPSNTVTAMRVLTAIQSDAPEAVADVSAEMWRAYWQEKRDIEDAAVLVGAVTRGAGVEEAKAKEWVAAAGDAAVKEALKATTAEAVERGMFGAPTMFVTADTGDASSGEDQEPAMFFGSDRFELMAHMFGLPWHGPVPPTSKL